MTPYIGNGIVKRVKTPVKQTFETFEKLFEKPKPDDTLQYADFDKIINNKYAQICYRAMGKSPQDIEAFKIEACEF